MTNPVFARHETFHPRYGWLKKGFDAASADPEVFVSPDAHVRLGVGKNMVRAIRYWGHAFKVLEDDPTSEGRTKGSRPTSFGEALLGDDGYDPYLEDLGSLWLLHWRLLQDPCLATAWSFTFFVNNGLDFTARALATHLVNYVRDEYPSARAAESSLKKDATCIIRMYGETSDARVSEESIQCPWAELRLLRSARDAKTYAFRMGTKPGLSAELVTAACLEYAATMTGEGSKTIALGSLVGGPGSPGLAFKLTESAIYAALESILAEDLGLGLADTAGVVQLSFEDPPRRIAERLIATHYAAAAAMEVLG